MPATHLVAHSVDRMMTLLVKAARSGIPVETRNGPAFRLDGVTILEYTNPMDRVSFADYRDANPTFHLIEAFWMLAGRNDAALPAQFAANMKNYSDDGVTLNGAYGERWARGVNQGDKVVSQLELVIQALKKDPGTRSAVLQMWDFRDDLVKQTKDRCCNMLVKFEIAPDTRLNMTVFNRSNDIWWGATGANAVHFSILQEYVAYRLSLHVGVYYQVSDNMHLYDDPFYGKPVVGWATPDKLHEPLPPVCVDNLVIDDSITSILHCMKYSTYDLGTKRQGRIQQEFLTALRQSNVKSPNLFAAKVLVPIIDASLKFQASKKEDKAQVAKENAAALSGSSSTWMEAASRWYSRRSAV